MTQNRNYRSILDPKGKSIFSSKDFFTEFECKLKDTKIPLRRKLAEAFSQAIDGQRKVGKAFIGSFKILKGDPFTKSYLHYPWTHADNYKGLTNLFQHHPAFIASFVDLIRQYYYYPVLDCWRRTQSISCFKQTSDYCARALPGTSHAAIDRAKVGRTTLVELVELSVPSSLKQTVLNSYTRVFGKRWEVFGGALFPFGYLKGGKSYGRLKSVPPSTLCNMNKDVKLCILRTIKVKHKISFFELDLKSCHAKIFESFFDWDGYDRKDLPKLDTLWTSMIDDFWEKAEEISFFDHIKNQIRTWPESSLKGLLKNQFYKALNGGMPDYAEDNVERSKTKLKIKTSDQDDFNEFLHLVFKEMKVFILESAFIEQINSGVQLFLPNDNDGFPVTTLSNKQAKKLAANPDYQPLPQTANSRLFSAMEFCLVMHVYAAIIEADCGWLVIGYEADGLLIAGVMNEEKAIEDLVKISAIFKETIKGLTTADHFLDIKNFI